MANLISEGNHSLIGFLTPEYLGFLKLQVIPRFTGTGTCISPVPVNRNRGILTSLLSQNGDATQHVQHLQQVQPPEKFSFNKPEDWQRWIRRFERYRVASALDKAPEENQVNTLI